MGETREMVKKILITFLLASTIWSGAQAQQIVCDLPSSNMVAYSDAMTNSTGWSMTATMVDYSDSTGGYVPSGLVNVKKSFRATLSAGNQVFLFNNVRGSYVKDGTLYKVSVLAKQGSGITWVGLGVSGAGTYFCSYNVVTGAAGSCTGLSNPTITPLEDGWYKLTALYTGNVAAIDRGIRLHLSPRTDSAGTAFTAAGGEYVYFSSPQVQEASVKADYYVASTDQFRAWGPPICGTRITPFSTSN